MQDRPQPEDQSEDSVLPEGELEPGRADLMLIEDQPVTFLKPETIPEDGRCSRDRLVFGPPRSTLCNVETTAGRVRCSWMRSRRSRQGSKLEIEIGL